MDDDKLVERQDSILANIEKFPEILEISGPEHYIKPLREMIWLLLQTETKIYSAGVTGLVSDLKAIELTKDTVVLPDPLYRAWSDLSLMIRTSAEDLARDQLEQEELLSQIPDDGFCNQCKGNDSGRLERVNGMGGVDFIRCQRCGATWELPRTTYN